MIKIKESTSSLGFIRPVKFERTGRIVERIADCSVDELYDLAFHHLEVIERAQGLAQNMSEKLEVELGWAESKELDD